MNTSITPGTTLALEREKSLNKRIKKIKKKYTCNFLNFILYFIDFIKFWVIFLLNNKKSPNTMI